MIRNELTAGGMIAGTILLGRALASVDQAIGSWKSLVAVRGAYNRVKSQLLMSKSMSAEALSSRYFSEH